MPRLASSVNAGANHGRRNREHDGIVGGRGPRSEREHVPAIGAFPHGGQAHPATHDAGAAGRDEGVAQSLRQRLVSLGDGVALGVIGAEVGDSALAACELGEQNEVQAALPLDVLAVFATEDGFNRPDQHVGPRPAARGYSWRFVLSSRRSAPIRRRVEVSRADAGGDEPHVLLHSLNDIAKRVDDRRFGVGRPVEPVEDLAGRVEQINPGQTETPHVAQDGRVPVVDELPAELNRPAGEGAGDRPDATADARGGRLIDGREDPGASQAIGAGEAGHAGADDRDGAGGAARLRPEGVGRSRDGSERA